MTIPNAAARYGLGVTYVENSGTWNPLKGMWINNADGTWHPVKTGWVAHEDGTWERIYPTPKGIFTPNVTTLTHTYYQHWGDTGNVIAISNTGDFDLTINNMVVNDNVSITTLSNSFPSFPITLTPGQSTQIAYYATGNTVGSFGGNIQFTNHTGYLGYANVTIPTTVNVLHDFNGVGIVGTIPPLVAYLGDDVTSYSYSGYSTNSFTVPAGVTSMQVVLAGGGGGGGGNDSHAGAPGSSGYVLSGTLSVSPGDGFVVYVGGGGGNGSSGSGNSGGAGGANDAGYTGGNGGNSGPAGWSGSGGGGGAATVLKKNGTVIAVAAGGGGGGGGGNSSYGQGPVTGQNGSNHNGADGAYKGGDGGGAGGGGGGNPGGIAGPLNGGDSGGDTGSNGYNLVPSGFTVSLANNGGDIYQAGGQGYATITEAGLSTSATQTVTIQNTGNGANLNIFNITPGRNYFGVTNWTANVIGYNFSTYTGNTTQINITPRSSLAVGSYTDYLDIYSDAVNAPVLSLPVSIQVKIPNGNAEFTKPGTFQWTVPAHVHSINLSAIGGGGSGGSGYNYLGGGGGGGGSGGYNTFHNVKVTPGETLTISVGAGGQSTADGSNRTVFTVTNANWGWFMNDYAVWTSIDGSSPINIPASFRRLWTAPYTGDYTLELSADNYAQVAIEGNVAGSYGNAVTSGSFTFAASQGNRVIDVSTINYGGPGGVAAVILNANNDIIWTTRDLLDPGSGADGEATVISGSFGTISVGGGAAGSSAVQTTRYYNDVVGGFGDGQAGFEGEDSGEDGTDGTGDGGGGGGGGGDG